MLTIHIAGPDILVGQQLRQRCGWCGAVLVDKDLTRVAVEAGENGPPVPTWPPGELVALDGAASYEVPHTPGALLPEGSCGNLRHEVTGGKPGRLPREQAGT